MKRLISYKTEVFSTKKLIFVITFCSCISNVSYQQTKIDGLLLEKGNSKFGIHFTQENYHNFYAGNRLISIPRIIKQYVLNGSYGITKDIDLSFHAPYIEVNNLHSGLQDLSLCFRFRFHQSKKIELLGGLGYSTPLSNYETETIYAIGQKNSTIDIKGIIHIWLHKNYFIEIQGSALSKSQPTPDATSVSLTIGTKKRSLNYSIWSEHYYSYDGTNFNGKGDLDPNNHGGLRSMGISYNIVGVVLQHNISRNLEIFANGAYSFSGRNYGKGVRFGGGIVYKIKKNNIIPE